MKKPILLFTLKCFVIVYVTAFTNIDRFSIAPAPESSGKVQEKTNKTQPVIINNNPTGNNLYAAQL